ncbi:helix-turn-helix domain-containing protein [Bacteroidota bacterium]
MNISIHSFLGKHLISTLVDSLKKDFSPTIESEDYLTYDFPFGKIKCSSLNSGLTIGLADLDENAPPLSIEFSGNDTEIPYKIGFCHKGKYHIDYQSENMSDIIVEGSNLIITPRNGSRMYTTSSQKVSFLYIFISPEFLNDYFSIKNKELQLRISHQEKVNFLYAKGINSPQINLALSELFRYDTPESLSKIVLESKTLELLSLFFQQFIVAENNFSNFEKDKILESHQYILLNIAKIITVKELISNTGLNEHKLQQGFKTLFGTTVQKHIKKLRVQKARTLILQKNYSISEAGYSVGYTNMSHFASAFRQEYGILPGEMKK